MLSLLSLTALIAAGSDKPGIHTSLVLILTLLFVGLALALAAPRLKIPYPILLIIGGLVLGFIPGLPRFQLDPELIFLLFLPPLIYSSAWSTSWRDFKDNFRPILLLATGLVLFTTLLVGIVAHAIVPSLPWAAAFVIGAIVSPTDAIAATSIAQRLGVPRRIVTIIEGESLVNDSTGLVAYQFAVAAVVTGAFSLWSASLLFVVESAGGILIGLALGWCLTFVHRHLDNPTLEIVITLLTPFAAYLLAEEIHVSGVLATVAAGLYLTRKSSVLFSAQTRQQALAVWTTMVFLLNALVFIFIGLELRNILDQLNDTVARHTTPNLLWYAVGVSVATIVVRILWVIPATYLPRLLIRHIRERDPYPNWRNVAVIGWAGMRGVISLAAALALPETTANGQPFPERVLIQFLTFSVILATLVFQGLSLPFVIRRLGLKDDGEAEREEIRARQVASLAALERIDQMIEEGQAPQDAAEHLRERYEVRAKSVAELADGMESGQEQERLDAYQRVEQETLQAARESIVELRDKGEINDEVMRRVERELDLQEQQLDG